MNVKLMPKAANPRRPPNSRLRRTKIGHTDTPRMIAQIVEAMNGIVIFKQARDKKAMAKRPQARA